MAILKDLIVHGSSRFLNKIYASEIQTPLIEAEAGIFKKLKADDATVVGLLDVKGQLHTNSWSNSNIATIDGSFYITPTIESGQGTVAITSSTLKFTRKDENNSFAIESLYLGDNNSITWPQYSKVLVTGQIQLNGEWTPLGTLLGQISGTATAASVTINNIKDNKNQNSNVYATLVNSGVSSTDYRNLKVSLYQRAASQTDFRPLGIYMTAIGDNGRTFLDIYGGVNSLNTTSSNYGGLAEPNVRIGNLQGLPNVGGQTPSGWGIYTDNGYFKGIIAADRGYIGSGSKYWVIANEEDLSNSENSRSYIYNGTDNINSNTPGVYLGTDGIRNYKDNNTYVNIVQGVITAKGVNLTGEITATRGTIGGCTIENGILKIANINITGTINGNHIDASSINIGDLNGVSNYALKTEVTDAEKVATSYITYIDSTEGIKIHNVSDQTNYLKLNSSAISMYRNNVETLNINNNEVRIGKIDSNNILIDNNSINIRQGVDTLLAQFVKNQVILNSVDPYNSSNNQQVCINPGGMNIENNNFIFNVGATTWTSVSHRWLSFSDKVRVNRNFSTALGKGNGTTYPNQVVIGKYAKYAVPLYWSGWVGNSNPIVTIDISDLLAVFNQNEIYVYDALPSASDGNTPLTDAEITIDNNNIIIDFSVDHTSFAWSRYASLFIYGNPDKAFVIGNGTSEENRSNAFTVDWNGSIDTEGDITASNLSINKIIVDNYNIEDTNNQYAFIVGNGTNDNNRSNAFTVDWNGNIEVAGDITANNLSINKINKIITGNYNIEDTNNQYAFAIGNGTSDNDRSNAFNVDWDGNTEIAGDLKVTGKLTAKNFGGNYLPSGRNINNLSKYDTGWWAYARSDVDGTFPVSDTYGIIGHIQGTSENVAMQIIRSNSQVATSPIMYMRYKISGTWGAWQRYVSATTSNLTITRTNNSYCNATDIGYLQARRKNGYLSLRGNLHLTTSLPNNTADVQIATISNWNGVSGILCVPAQTGNSTILVTITATGVIAIANYSGTATGANWFRFVFTTPCNDGYE